MEKYYIMLLTIAYPSKKTPSNIEDKKGDISNAAEKFNRKFSSVKQIDVENIEYNSRSIKIKLKSSTELNNATRELSYFSQILVKDFKWDELSSKTNRLFNIRLLEQSNSTPEGNNSILGENLMQQLKDIIIECDNNKQIDASIVQLEKLIKIAETKKMLNDTQNDF